MRLKKSKLETPQTSALASALAGIQVLLVEDEQEIAALFTFVLREAGADIIPAFEASQALAMLKYEQPDVLVSNLKLPDQDGVWLIRHIRSHWSSEQLPAIAVTSYLREFAEETALSNGFQKFLPKPIDPDELISSIVQLIKRPA